MVNSYSTAPPDQIRFVKCVKIRVLRKSRDKDESCALGIVVAWVAFLNLHCSALRRRYTVPHIGTGEELSSALWHLYASRGTVGGEWTIGNRY